MKWLDRKRSCNLFNIINRDSEFGLLWRRLLPRKDRLFISDMVVFSIFYTSPTSVTFPYFGLHEHDGIVRYYVDTFLGNGLRDGICIKFLSEFNVDNSLGSLLKHPFTLQVLFRPGSLPISRRAEVQLKLRFVDKYSPPVLCKLDVIY